MADDDTPSSSDQLDLFSWAASFLKKEAKWLPLISSNLRSFRYDADNSILEVRFHNGREYRYIDVDTDTAAGLASAPSAGSYFHNFIRDQYITIEQ